MNKAKRALYWNTLKNGEMQCQLCPHQCKIKENAAGLCGVRVNQGGELIATSYGQVSSMALDPIEKKPLNMFHPGKRILSIGSFGCNLRCPFCQNYEISIEYERKAEVTKPGAIVSIAQQTVPNCNIGVAYTYNEPLIGYEFLHDCAQLVHEAGLYNVLVTNGYINKEPLKELLPLIDAMNIDLKGFGAFYGKLGGRSDVVKETIEISHKQCHVEVATLIITDENEGDIEEIAEWLSSIDPEIPLHISRFFPRYRYMDRQPTPPETIFRLHETAKAHLKNIFIGNM